MGILIKPIVTEKLTVQGEKLNRYGFIVDREANKLQIKAAVEQAYNVTVADINTVNYHGKNKARYTKAGIYVGGGRVFGPQPRCYRKKLNKKLKQLARFSALSYKAQENAITMVEPFVMEAPKTKEFIQILKNIKAGSRKVLFVLPENSTNIYLSSRNLPEVKVITVDEINTYAIMNSNSMVLVDGVQDILASRIRR